MICANIEDQAHSLLLQVTDYSNKNVGFYGFRGGNECSSREVLSICLSL
jgi:hypothetical protein